MSLGYGVTESRERGSAGALCPSSCPWASTLSAPARYYNFSLSWGEWKLARGWVSRWMGRRLLPVIPRGPCLCPEEEGCSSCWEVFVEN